MTEVAAGPPLPGSQAGPRPEAIKAIPVRHPWRWVSTVVVVAIVAEVVYIFITAPNMEWGAVKHFLSGPLVLQGVVVTLELTVIAMVIGVALGIVLAVMRLSPNPVVSSVSWLYIWFFRGTPVLVQIFFWYNVASILPYISLGVPGGPFLLHVSTNDVVSPIHRRHSR